MQSDPAVDTMDDDLLSGLNTDQREAAETLLGPLRVLAGAGTGKTRVITSRIANGIHQGIYDPSKVMALTFTAKAAAEMRMRLRALGVPPVAARTFHAAALAQLRYFWPTVVGSRAPKLLESKASVLAGAADRSGLTVSAELLRQLAGEIEWRKIRDLTIDEYSHSVRAQALEIPLETMLQVMRRYERAKDEQRAIDYEDVLLVTAGMMGSEPAVAERVRDQYRYFVVDEYQDVSPVQQQLLELWLGNRRDLCVVGDASQTIYSFAGADANYLLHFDGRFPGAKTIELTENYRSTESVVTTANRLMRGGAGAVTLHATETGEPPTLTEYDSDSAEADAVASRIAGMIARGVRASDIAILMRVNAQSALFERALDRAGVPFGVRNAKPYFSRPEVIRATLELSAVRSNPDIANRPLALVVSDIIRHCGWVQDAPREPGPAREVWESLDMLLRLAESSPEGTSLEDFVAELAARKSHQFEPEREAITISTIHAAKGLEWEAVFVCGLSEGLLPISQAESAEQIDEERRLLYVAITRARRSLALSWARTGRGGGRMRQLSRFAGSLGLASHRVR